MGPWFWSFFACTAIDEDWERIPITSAWLEQFDRSTIALIGGGFGGDALLVWQGPFGIGAVPTHIGGGTLGLAIALNADLEGHDGVVPIDLTDVQSPTVADVFGTYRGTGAAAVLGAGIERSRVRHTSGASFREDHLAVGLGLWVGLDWIRLSPDDVASTTLYTTPYTTSPYTTPPYTTPPYTTSPYTTPPSTPPAGDTGSASPNSAPDDSRGCGCGGDGGDSTAPAVDTGDGPPDTGGGTSSDCDCATGPARMRAWWLWMGLAAFWRSRRRSASAPSGQQRAYETERAEG